MKYAYDCTQLQMRKASKPSQTINNNYRLEGFKSTNVPLGSSHHDVDYKDDEDSMFMVGVQFSVTTIFLPNQIKVVKKLLHVAQTQERILVPRWKIWETR
jgi:hypothetical protein